MTQIEIIERLERWKERVEKLETQMAAFRKLTNSFESDFADSIYRVVDAYTGAVSELVGDKSKWLNYYMFECEMGRKPLEVTFASGKTIKLRTLGQLARVIRNV